MPTLSSFLALLSIAHRAIGAPHPNPQLGNYINWRTFQGHGVNLGGWLEQESTIDTTWWATYSGGASDEWGLCANLGAQCKPVMEQRYETFITTAHIDKLAAAGITVLRIPTTYAAWIQMPGSQLYSGRQQEHVRRIATYAITKHDMHVVLDIHSLPGGTNGLDIGEAVGHWGWWHNETALTWSLRAVDAAVAFIAHSGHPGSYSLSPINEPADNHNFSAFGTAAALSDDGAVWLARYINKVLAAVAAVDARIPVMFQGSFKAPEFWTPYFDKHANMVIDVHHYYWQYSNSSSANLPAFLCADARASQGDGTFPTFVGEWAMEAGTENELGLRGRNLQAGLSAFAEFTHGSTYWNSRFLSNATTEGEGLKQDYWSYEEFIEAGLTGSAVIKQYCKKRGY
ncbi:hypothetical protein N7462_004079 [Penicillium macrosclerotiorum]|uniref:uncharacterized protein n=1 Tax=Penicillium macrosclerotiorum TaxID=303699 RepID=UPI0025496C5D|nr:uncharacterized protein N7462_004079 [Penicillium macrosclerotiorum]KAJ5689687.1 hypothetical protein N7462_004079 [Penicillium macrosclerotiorum]